MTPSKKTPYPNSQNPVEKRGSQDNPPDEPQIITLGKIVRPHGIRGELRMQVHTAYPEFLSRVHTIYLNRRPKTDNATTHTLKSVRFHQQMALLTVEGIESRNDADLWRGYYVMASRSLAAPLEDGEIYLTQLLGLSVYTEDGEFLGNIDDIIETGANDVFVLRGTERGDILIPDTDEVVQNIDLDAQKVTIILIPGLLPDDE
jgi:16S rRNA processing protein RimM